MQCVCVCVCECVSGREEMMVALWADLVRANQVNQTM